jgi:RNA polymerase sigma factor (sigma-70 family)
MSTSSFDPARTRQSLLIRVRDLGDQQAWAEFHARYAPMIGGWCRRWFPREADDMVQEVLLLLARRLRTFEYEPGPARFRGYLKTVTRRLMADLKEKEQARPLVGGDGLVEEAEASQDLWDRLAAEYDLELLAKAKENVRGRIEPRTWSAYVETAERGRKGAEVARDLGMKVGAVQQAKYHVLNLLRDEVEFLEHSCGREVLS